MARRSDPGSVLFVGGMGLLAALTLLLLVAPTLVVLTVSFTSGFSLKFPPPSYSLRWYEELMNAEQLHFAAWNSVKVALATTLIAIGLGVPGALAIARSQTATAKVLDSLFMSPLVLPALAFGFAALMTFSAVGWAVSTTTLVIGHAAVCVPYVIRTTTAALAQMDPALLESSASLGATRAYTFRRITWPLVRPGVLAGRVHRLHVVVRQRAGVAVLARCAHRHAAHPHVARPGRAAGRDHRRDVRRDHRGHAGDDAGDGARHRVVAPTAVVVARDPARAAALWLGGVMALAVFALQAVPVLGPAMALALGLPPAFVGVWSAAVWSAALVGTLAAPSLLARCDAWWLARACLLLCAAGVASAASGHLAGLVLGALLIGLGHGIEGPMASHLLASHVPPPRRALWFSVKQTGVQVGAVAASLLLPLLALALGWRAAAVAVVVLTLGCSAALLVPAASLAVARAAPAVGGPLGALVALRRTPVLRALALSAAAFGAVQVTLNGFLVTWAVTERGASLVQAGAWLGAAQAGGLVGRPAVGLGGRPAGPHPARAAGAGPGDGPAVPRRWGRAAVPGRCWCCTA